MVGGWGASRLTALGGLALEAQTLVGIGVGLLPRRTCAGSKGAFAALAPMTGLTRCLGAFTALFCETPSKSQFIADHSD